MNRRFRLTAVERLRAGKLADAARALARARREVTAALRHRDRVKAELQATTAAWRCSPAEHQAAADRRIRLREDLVLAGERCSTARSQEIAALATWSAARADLRAVEMLHERHRLTLAEADARAEQRDLDEFAVLSLHRRREVDAENGPQDGEDT